MLDFNATINGVEFKDPVVYSMTVSILCQMKAPECIMPSNELIGLMRDTLSSDELTTKQYNAIVNAFDNQHYKIADALIELCLVTSKPIIDLWFGLEFGKPFILKLNDKQHEVLAHLRPVLIRAVEMGLISDDAQKALMCII